MYDSNTYLSDRWEHRLAHCRHAIAQQRHGQTHNDIGGKCVTQSTDLGTTTPGAVATKHTLSVCDGE